MAAYPLFTALLFALALSATAELSTSHVLEGKVSCFDCNTHYDFSGIKVLVKCEHIKKMAMATTEASGSFKVELPSGSSKTASPPLNCQAKLFGGPDQLYASKKHTVSKIMKKHKSSNTYKISTPLAFSITKPKAAANNFEESKTVDLPLPPEWGFAPSSYYVPFFPIIGIP